MSATSTAPTTPSRRWRSVLPAATSTHWVTNSATQAVISAPCTCTSKVKVSAGAKKGRKKYDRPNPKTTTPATTPAAGKKIQRSFARLTLATRTPTVIEAPCVDPRPSANRHCDHSRADPMELSWTYFRRESVPRTAIQRIDCYQIQHPSMFEAG